ncbi:MAG: helix-turn-helix domain-containing protein [Acidobacteriota bacterium]|nr:helix-turn-helix domain-containing protein [Xanthomonadaceae bacterium]MDE3188902.1 helix-turn-helix domain-containing protein [Acidobacteriota bacterium]
MYSKPQEHIATENGHGAVILRDGEVRIPPLVHQVDAAARRLGVSRSTFYAMVRDGSIDTFKIGGRVVVAESELRRVVAEAMQVAA